MMKTEVAKELEYYRTAYKECVEYEKGRTSSQPQEWKIRELFNGKIPDFWEYVSYCIPKDPSSEFIDEFQDHLEWQILSRYHDFYEDECLKHKDKVNQAYVFVTSCILNTIEKPLEAYLETCKSNGIRPATADNDEWECFWRTVFVKREYDRLEQYLKSLIPQMSENSGTPIHLNTMFIKYARFLLAKREKDND